MVPNHPAAAGPVAVEGKVAAALADPSATAAAPAVATAACSAAQLLQLLLLLSPQAQLDQPRPTEAGMAKMEDLLLAVVL